MKMKIAYIQTQPIFGDIDGNISRALEPIANMDADLVVLPELYDTGYQFRDKRELKKLAFSKGKSPAVEAARESANRFGTYVVGGFAEAADSKCFNSAFLVGPDGLLSVYRKIHLFENEKYLFDPGDRPFAVHDIGIVKIGIMICFDWAFPESARSLALLGAQVIAHPSNLVMPYCQKAMITRSLENAVYIVTANRIGTENRHGEKLTFTGCSQITGTSGDILAKAPENAIEAKAVKINPDTALNKKINKINDRFGDRRTIMYYIT